MSLLVFQSSEKERVCHFLIGILGQVWYLIVSIPDLCTLIYFDKFTLCVFYFFMCACLSASLGLVFVGIP